MAASRLAKLALLLLATALPVSAQVVLTEGTNLNVDVASDGRIATDLLGGIWIVPMDGGEAVPLDKGLLPARRPRWSPDGKSLVYQARSGDQEQLWRYDFGTRQSSRISDGHYFDQHPSWHSDGERIVFSSDRKGSGFDLWELDLPTGLTWRLSDLPGDETEPVWSADGRDLLYVHEQDGQWSLRLRRRGEPEEILVNSDTRLAAPSWGSGRTGSLGPVSGWGSGQRERRRSQKPATSAARASAARVPGELLGTLPPRRSWLKNQSNSLPGWVPVLK